MFGAISVLIAVQYIAKSGSLSGVDRMLNSARPIVPALVGLGVVGGGLLVIALVHGLVTDATWYTPGKVSGPYTFQDVTVRKSVGVFRGYLLGGASFQEESGFSEIKRSWHTGDWRSSHRLLRATLVMAGLPLLVLGVFGAVALATDVTAVRLLLLVTLAYMVVRLTYALVRA